MFGNFSAFPPVKSYSIWKAFAIAFLCLTVGIGGGLGILNVVTAGPVVSHDVSMNGDIEQVGSRVEISYQFEKDKDCPANVTYFMSTKAIRHGKLKDIILPIYSTTTALVGKGNDWDFNLSLPLPAGVWDGKWDYYFRVEFSCPILPGFMNNILHVMPPKQSKPREFNVSIGSQDIGETRNEVVH